MDKAVNPKNIWECVNIFVGRVYSSSFENMLVNMLTYASWSKWIRYKTIEIFPRNCTIQVLHIFARIEVLWDLARPRIIVSCRGTTNRFEYPIDHRKYWYPCPTWAKLLRYAHMVTKATYTSPPKSAIVLHNALLGFFWDSSKVFWHSRLSLHRKVCNPPAIGRCQYYKNCLIYRKKTVLT